VAQAPPGAKAVVTYRSSRELRFGGPKLRLAPQTVPVPADGRLPLAAPAQFPTGTTLAEVTVRTATGQAVTWGSYALASAQAIRLLEIATDKPTYQPGDEVKLTLKTQATKPVSVTVEGKLVDAFGRVEAIKQAQHSSPGGESTFALALPLARPLCVQHKAFVRLLVDGREQDSRWVPVKVPALGRRLAAADFVVTTWGPGMHPLIMEGFAERTCGLGLNSEFAINQVLAGEHGQFAAGYSGGAGAFREEYHPGDVRKRCLSDPAVVKAYTEEARQAALLQQPDGPYAVGITDEALLSDGGQRQELCFCPLCQARFQKWLQERYPSLDALNAEWGTAYASWEQVRGAKTEDVRGKDSFAPFVDFRTFMTDEWVEACRTITAAYHEAAPEVPMGHTNTFGCNPFNGNDYWKLATQSGFGWGQEYSEAIKDSANKAIFDLWRSFVGTPEAARGRTAAGQTGSVPFFNYGWVGYDRQTVATHYEPWWLALHGSRGVSYFATCALDPPRGRSYALVYPSLSLTGYSQGVQEALADLQAGCGKLFIEYQREQPQVALLWSHPSLLTAWGESNADQPEPNEREGTDAYGSYFNSAFNFRQHLNELQLDYIYVTPDQVLGSEVLKRCPVLILPFTIAASEALVARLAAYVNGGGVLVGDLRCLRTDEHGKPVPDSAALRRLFGVRRTGPADYGKTTLRFAEAAEGLDLSGRELTVYGRERVEAAGAGALAAHATGEPALLVQPRGKGLSVYLNFGLPRYDATVRELVRQLVQRAGIKREVTVEPRQGEAPPRCYERNTFARGANRVHAFIRDFRRCSDNDPVLIHFGRKAHVYDVRARKHLGLTESVEATIPPGETAVYACLPYRVTAVDTKLPGRVAAGTDARLSVAVKTDGGPVGDHVLHVELLDPQKRSVWCYASNQLAVGGKLELALPLALNDAPGQWTVRVRDVLTGTSAQATFAVYRQ